MLNVFICRIFVAKNQAMQFVDIKNDVAFRKIFGNENKKIILISFLNAVMKLKGKDVIEDVEILNPYQLPIIKNLKASIIDVKARDKKGKTYIIEMQVAEPDGLDKRLLYYASKDYSQQIESGEYYTELKPVIFIGIFDFKFTQSNKHLSHHAVCDVEDGERVIKDMDFYFIELPKFRKALEELVEVTDKWIFFIKEAENLDVVPENLDDEGLMAAYQDANKHSWTKDELEAYDYAAMREQDERGKVELAEKRADKKAKNEIAKEMKNDGEPVHKIMKYTGLTEDEINEI
ncbi:MAG: Rpn family recombination-promoting nuclease/putative transposase [Saprospiraceae bacterium]|jgi:predicted transposase/invertase (TIGR01784 family)|nr:Rpn family recombination-promoting nuclease/putative transposase [Saprospiraceae bacterium]